MHGVIFTGFRHFVVNRLGAEAAAEIWGGEPQYLLTATYDDGKFVQLLERAATQSGIATDDLLRDFGGFAAESTFALLYPRAFSEVAESRAFLLRVEERIHQLVRATIPGAEPPRLTIAPAGAAGVRIVYDSPRGLCPLLEGLVAGVARRYRERVKLDTLACMRRGDAACIYEAKFERIDR